jgi:hypothetical protein
MNQKTVNVGKLIGPLIIGDSPEYNIDSVISELLRCMAMHDHEYRPLRRKPSAETIKKISHNNIKSKQHIIKQYLDFSSKVEVAYDVIDSSMPFGKQIITQRLNDLYFAALDELDIDYYQNEIDIGSVRNNSIFIIEFIINKLKQFAYESKNKPKLKEYIEIGVNVVVAHAFIECIVMETP